MEEYDEQEEKHEKEHKEANNQKKKETNLGVSCSSGETSSSSSDDDSSRSLKGPGSPILNLFRSGEFKSLMIRGFRFEDFEATRCDE